MNSEQVIKGQAVEPRFEFRSFGQDFDSAAKRMARLSVPVPENIWERSSDEIYILSRMNDINNVKIRDGKMDIKAFVRTVDGLEQWNPLLKSGFPMNVMVLKEQLFPVFQVTIPALNKEIYTYDDFIDLVYHHPQLQAVKVRKLRFAYNVNNTICETGIILINGARVLTICTESSIADDVRRTIKDIGLEGVENINYIQALKRVTGMINKSLAN